MGSARESMAARRSLSKVTAEAPSDEELVRLLAAAGRAADHATLHPWRVIALRGAARERLGHAFVEHAGLSGEAAEKLATKPLRASLLLAVVVRIVPSEKVDEWEQEAAAAGVAHYLSLLLDEAGWGVMWRSGRHTRSEPVARMHGLGDDERLLGWLYVGGVPESGKPARHELPDAAASFSVLD